MDPVDAFIANALNLMMAMLVVELDKRGAMSKSDFSAILRKTADDAEAAAAPDIPKPRIDLALMRATAQLIEDGPKGPPASPSWTPTVVEGGKS